MKKIKVYITNFLGHYWVILISCILLVASIFLNISHIIITKESIVISFVGILASIIVVGNFAHVSAMKTEIYTEIEKIREQQEAMQLTTDSLINQFNDSIDKFQ